MTDAYSGASTARPCASPSVAQPLASAANAPARAFLRRPSVLRRSVPRPLVLLTACAALFLSGCAATTEQDPRLGPGANAHLGAAMIEKFGCGSCHTIPGIPGARANVGPPLTAMGRRSYIAGVLPNSPSNLETWISHPHSIRPDTAMPDMGISSADAKMIAAYLYTLR